MKLTRLLLTISILQFAAHAEQPLEQIIQKRDAILSELLELAKKRTDPTDVYDAAMRLYSFRRDNAKEKPDRLKSQELILAMEQAAAKDVRSRIAVGLARPEDELIAEERILAAEQKLAELRLAK
jgi:hypothetical protein